MFTAENIDKDKVFLPNVSTEKILSEIDNDISINLEPGELKFFLAEIKEMIDAKKIIDLPKAIHNAKYFAMLEEREKEIDSGKFVSFTEEEWENFVNEQKV